MSVRIADLPTSAWVLIGSNLVPLAGVIVFGWNLGLILLLYWAESAVILFFSLAKLVSTAGPASVVLVPFFIVHAGMFMGVHLMFLLFLFVDKPAAGWDSLAGDLAFGWLAFVASHGYSFFANHRGRGETYAKPQDVMGAFYSRVIVMHLTILFGGGIAIVLGQPAWALVLLIGLKTGADALAHVRERAKRAPKPIDPSAPPTAS